MSVIKSVYGVMNGKDVHAFIIENSQKVVYNVV